MMQASQDKHVEAAGQADLPTDQCQEVVTDMDRWVVGAQWAVMEWVAEWVVTEEARA